MFLKKRTVLQRLGSNNLAGYSCCPDFLTTQKLFPVPSRRVSVCFVLTMLAGEGKKVR